MMRVGVIGCGYWGPNLIRNFNGLADAEVVTIADLDQDRLAKVGLLYPSTKKTTDHREIIDDPTIDAVVVATAMSSHFALGMEALEAGIPNLLKHIENITGNFGLPAVVAINRFPTDSPKELELVESKCRELGVNVALSEVWAKGGEGGEALAREWHET